MCFSALSANSFIYICRIDTRSNDVTGKPTLIHKKGSKVTGLHCHPLQPDLLLSCGNDHFVSSSLESFQLSNRPLPLGR